MEPCPTGSCAMGIAKEATEAAAGAEGARLALSAEPPFSSLLWGGQEEVALDVPVLAGMSLSETEAALEPPPVGRCLSEEWPEALSPSSSTSSRKGGLEAAVAAEELFPEPLSRRAEEAPLPEFPGEPYTSADPATAQPPNTAAPSRRKCSRGRKPWKKAAAHGRGSGLVLPWGEAEGPGPSENGPAVPGRRVPKKRGRKSKAELLLLKLSQECQAAESSSQQKVDLAASEEDLQCLETTPGGRPKRRAAKVALLYLQELAEELTTAYQAPPCAEIPEGIAQPREPGRKRRGRKPKGQRSEAEEDADFVPSEEGLLLAEEEEEEEEEERQEEERQVEEEEEESTLLLSEVSEPELEPALPGAARPRAQCRGFAPNGLHKSVMAPVWTSLSITHRWREQLHSPWEFPEWIPSAHRWAFLSENEAVDYLPGEAKSPLFSIRREGLQEDRGILYRINRFNALHPHEERLDMTFFVGGPVWALEWCPTPEGSGASQYIALSCNPGMDDRHTLAGTHSGPALLQLWEVGPIQQDAGSATKPALAYGIATDHGCIWDLKFCPSGGWEPPSTCHQSPQMSRLGLLAVAFSDGQVLIYTLPHAEDVHTHWRAQVTGVGATPRHAICKVSHVASLQVGSVQAGNAVECGQCFTVAWLPSKPHHHLAAGFYDGTVALWNLTTKSLLQRVRQPDGALKLYPFRCFLAHDHAVRHIQWCKANSHFMVTAGNDRKVKFWDLRRLHEPLNSIKRFLSTETAWLLPYSGVTVAQDNCYASYGLCGIHYLDAGYLGFRAYFVAPRKGTVWSISGSDWLNTVAAGDVTGELVAAVMPDLSINPHNIKRPSERRFPVYKADLLPCGLLSKEAATTRPTERTPVGGRTYSESVAQNYLLFRDPDLRSFKNVFRQKPRTPHPPRPEAKEGDGLGRLQLEAVHKVRFSPNLDCHSWLVSGGQSGLVRLHCLRALASPLSHKLLRECQAQFGAMFDRGGGGGGEGEASPCSPPEVPAAVS